MLKPEVTLPVQFERIWHGLRPVAPERALLVSVLWQAFDDLRKCRHARRRRRQRLYMEAYQWVASNDRGWPLSFVNICEALSLSPEFLRAQLLSEPAAVTERAA